MTELWMNIIVGIVVRQLDRTELDLREQDQSSNRKQWWCHTNKEDIVMEISVSTQWYETALNYFMKWLIVKNDQN